MIRVAIVDDHPVARHGLTAILSAVPERQVVAAVADRARLPLAGAVDVVVCDPYPFREPPRLEVVRELAAWVAVLVMSASQDSADLLAAMQAGARGYVTKHAGDEVY